MATTTIHDARACIVTLAGIVIRDGLADEFFTIERPEAYTWKASVSGGGTRSATNDDGATVKLKLMRGSPHNSELEALLALDRATPGGAGVGSFSAQDANGEELYKADKAWIEKPADSAFAKEDTEREWTIRVSGLKAV